MAKSEVFVQLHGGGSGAKNLENFFAFSFGCSCELGGETEMEIMNILTIKNVVFYQPRTAVASEIFCRLRREDFEIEERTLAQRTGFLFLTNHCVYEVIFNNKKTLYFWCADDTVLVGFKLKKTGDKK